MRVYSYVVASDSGFAPNPFHGICTLAGCKPKVQETGDGSVPQRRQRAHAEPRRDDQQFT